MQSQQTIHKLLNDLKKYAGRMIMQPDAYTFHKRFIAALHESLQNEVLKQGFNAEFSTIKQLYKTARMLEEGNPNVKEGLFNPSKEVQKSDRLGDV
jgi:hypothetical protein